MRDQQAMLSFQHFNKMYGKHSILKWEHLDLPTGIHWIKGENGSGKTTLFKCVAGYIPFGGDITIGNVSQKNRPVEYRAQVAYSEAEPQFPGFLNSTSLIQFVGRTRKSSPNQQHELISKFKIDEFQHEPCSQYSSGMLKKLSILLSFLGKPKLILLDEPLTTLDLQSQQTLCELIERLHQTEKVTFLISSHHDLANWPIAVTHEWRIQHKNLNLC